MVNADNTPVEAGDIDHDDHAASLAGWPAPGAAPAEDCDGPSQGDPRDDDW